MNELYCFVPSWYTEGERWHAFPQSWHGKKTRIEFDDTVNQIRLFHNAGENVRVILPFYMPELRRFLHREGILDVDAYSVFDSVQGIHIQRVGIFSYKNLRWPENIEWVYTPFVAEAFIADELYARVEFGEGGHVVYIDRFKDGIIDNRLYVDDRGFISCMEKYRDGKKIKRIYYRPDKQWCMKEDVKDGTVMINNRVVQNCCRNQYPDMLTLLSELIAAELTKLDDSTVLITAYDQRHNALFQTADIGCKKVYSLFSGRNHAEDLLQMEANSADLIVTDTEYLQQKVLDRNQNDPEYIINISPYDARVRLGQSQRIKEQKILCYLGNALETKWMDQVAHLLSYVNRKKDVTLEIGITSSEMYLSLQDIKNFIAFVIEKNKLDRVHLEEAMTGYAENEEKDPVIPNVFLKECGTEKEVITVLKDTRIIFDTQSEPDLYLQIAGVSAGVPMIIRSESQYVTHRKNGWILQDQELPDEALDYFLQGLEHWNQALVYAVDKIAGYTNGEIVNKWKQQLGLQE